MKKMSKFLVSILIISLLSILYVFQQTKLLEYSYAINSNQKYMSLLFDQNKQLRYNVVKLETPARLEDIMLAKEGTGVYMPETWYKIQVAEQKTQPLQEMIVPPSPFIRAGRVLLNTLSLSTEAVAKELNQKE